MFCSNCGSKLDEKAKFCGTCGFNVADEYMPAKQQAETSVPAEPLSSPQYVDTSTTPQPQTQQPFRQHVPQNPMIESYGTAGMPRSQFLPPKRNYFNWLLLNIISFGIANYIYIYLNFDDMEKLHNATWEPNTPPTNDGGAIGLLLYILFSPAAYFLKYDKLHKHIEATERATGRIMDKPASGVIAVLTPFAFAFIIFISLIIFWPLGLLAIVVFWGTLIYLEYNWQKAMNAHIDFHTFG